MEGELADFELAELADFELAELAELADFGVVGGAPASRSLRWNSEIQNDGVTAITETVLD